MTPKRRILLGASTWSPRDLSRYFSTYFWGEPEAPKYVQRNFVKYSEDFSQSTHTKSNVTVSSNTNPDGATTSCQLTAGATNSTCKAAVTTTAVSWVYKVQLKRVSGAGNIDITMDGTTYVTQTITNAWAWYTVTQTGVAGTSNPGIRIATSGDVVLASHAFAYPATQADTTYQKILADWPTTYAYFCQTDGGVYADAATAYAAGFREPLKLNYQDSAGTRIAEATNVAGLLVDKSKDAALGPELVANGTDFPDTTGWTATNATLSVDTGRLKVTATGSAAIGIYAVTTVIGKTYFLVATATHGTSTGNVFNTGATNTSNGGGAYAYTGNLAPGTISLIFTATATTTYLTLRKDTCTNGDTMFWDNVSLRELPGNHATQTTTANKPTYNVDARGVPVLRHDTTDVLTVTAPSTFGNAASVYYATGSAVTSLHGENVDTSYNLPGKPGAGTADVYGWIITPTRPDTATENRIIKYLAKRAGL